MLSSEVRPDHPTNPSSPFFPPGLLSSLPLQTTAPLQPAVLYMRGVTGPALLKLLDFMYNGEANVEHGLLKEFLQVGEDLRYREDDFEFFNNAFSDLQS